VCCIIVQHMTLSAQAVKQLLAERGWLMADVAARWEISITWMSRLVNNPHSRPKVYEDAFAGLPPRDAAVVHRQVRHNRRRKPADLWGPERMFPAGRIFEAIDNAVADEGTRLFVARVEGQGEQACVVFRLEGQPGELRLDLHAASVHLCDLGLDKSDTEKRQKGTS
jgi:hypothetical protein